MANEKSGRSDAIGPLSDEAFENDATSEPTNAVKVSEESANRLKAKLAENDAAAEAIKRRD